MDFVSFLNIEEIKKATGYHVFDGVHVLRNKQRIAEFVCKFYAGNSALLGKHVLFASAFPFTINEYVGVLRNKQFIYKKSNLIETKNKGSICFINKDRRMMCGKKVDLVIINNFEWNDRDMVILQTARLCAKEIIIILN